MVLYLKILSNLKNEKVLSALIFGFPCGLVAVTATGLTLVADLTLM
jgi:hypothetical protein